MQQEARWYRLADMPPPYNVRVWLQGPGWTVLAERRRDKRTGQIHWAEIKRHVAATIIKIPSDGLLWDGSPYLWRPQHPDKWQLPLPEPVRVLSRGSMTMIGMRYDAVSDAQLAQETEANREAARSRPVDQETPRESRWWRDITQISYQRRGEVTLRMAEGRVLRALAWCEHRRGLTLKSVTAGVVLARLADENNTEAKEDEQGRWEGLQRFRPLPADHGDFAVAMHWFTRLNPPETWHKRRKAWALNRTQRVLLVRSLDVPLTWAEIAYEFETSVKRAQQIYTKGIEAVWRVANGYKAYRGQPSVDHMKALRERNRAYHRQGA